MDRKKKDFAKVLREGFIKELERRDPTASYDYLYNLCLELKKRSFLPIFTSKGLDKEVDSFFLACRDLTFEDILLKSFPFDGYRWANICNYKELNK